MYVYKYIYTASNTFYISLKYAILPFKKNIYCKVGILKFLDLPRHFSVVPLQIIKICI